MQRQNCTFFQAFNSYFSSTFNNFFLSRFDLWIPTDFICAHTAAERNVSKGLLTDATWKGPDTNSNPAKSAKAPPGGTLIFF